MKHADIYLGSNTANPDSFKLGLCANIMFPPHVAFQIFTSDILSVFPAILQCDLDTLYAEHEILLVAKKY